ncbi:hypothetical protein [Pseudomonas sp. NPDC096950]|uniref:hypothetical protein n=1 Tax=Pseudomonas sp. NPDC096950 TaxID=3364485 RepID=UPI00383B3266
MNMSDQNPPSRAEHSDDLADYSPGSVDSPTRPETEPTFHELGPETILEDDKEFSAYSSEIPEPTAPQRKPFSKKEMLLMAVGGVFLIGVAIFLGNIAIAKFWGHSTPKPTGVNTEQFGNTNTNQGRPGANNSLQDAENLASALGGNSSQSSSSGSNAYVVPSASGEVDLEPEMAAGQPLASLPVTQQQPTPVEHLNTAVVGSAEEQAYDDLVDQASKLNVPGSAIKIDDNVVKQNLAKQGAAAAEASVQQDRKQIAELRTLTNDLQATMKSLNTTMEAIAKNQERVTKEQESISSTLANVTSEMKTLKGTVDANKKDFNLLVAEAVKRAKGSTDVKEVRPTLAVKPQPVVKPQLAKATTEVINVQLPPPQKVVAQTAPTYEENHSPAEKCTATSVSSNWRVKGINKTSAYIVRAQDGQGMIVRNGEQVPGFGTAISFDRYSRQVCTTNGLINR